MGPRSVRRPGWGDQGGRERPSRGRRRRSRVRREGQGPEECGLAGTQIAIGYFYVPCPSVATPAVRRNLVFAHGCRSCHDGFTLQKIGPQRRDAMVRCASVATESVVLEGAK